MGSNEGVKLISKYKLQLALITIVISVYFALRLPNLTLQPIFADEAIYIRWAQVMRAEPTLRFLPLSDGKTPLFMWALMPLLKVFDDPLYAGRLLSVLSGLATLLGTLVLGWKFFNWRVGIWSALLIATTPYMVFFDRMALVDSMLSALTTWSLFIALWLVHNMRLDLAMILGYLLGGGMLTKTPGVFNLVALPATLLAFSGGRGGQLVKLLGLWVVALIIAMTIYNILRLGPGFNNLSSRNQDYIHPLTRLLEYPVDPFIPHFRDIVNWFPQLLTVPVLVAVIAGIVGTLIFKNRIGLVVFIWSLIPLIIQMFLLKTFTARYLLFSIPPLLVLGSWAIDLLLNHVSQSRRLIVMGVVAILLATATLNFNLKLLDDPATAPLPRAERRGYLEDWTAGYGFSEIAKFLKEQAKGSSVVVGTEGYFGTLPDGLWIYLDSTPNIAVIGGKATISAQLKDAARQHQTYFVANKGRFQSVPGNLELIKEYPKAIGPEIPPDAIVLFKVKPVIGE